MKFSSLLSAFLATLVVSSPITGPRDVSSSDVPSDIHALSARAIEDTAEYTRAISARPGLVKDKYYWFKLEWPLTAPIEGDKQSSKELQELQKKLGFAHIGVVVGQITETTTGKGKNEKTKRDFKATLLHMTKKNVTPGDTELKSPNWKQDPKQNLKWGGETTAKKVDAAKKEAKTYVADNKVYKVDGNNCNDFANAVIAKLK